MKKIALFDVCHTLVNVTTISDFIENFLLSRKCNKHFSILKKLYHFVCKIMWRLDIISREQYHLHFAKLFKGYSDSEIDELALSYSDYLNTILKTEIIARLRNLKTKGYEIYLVTAGFDVYLKPFAESINAELISTRLEKNSDGLYTGNISGVDCVGDGKVKKIKTGLDSDEVDWENSFAFGDEWTDIPMLSLVGNPYVVEADDRLEIHARMQNWGIIGKRKMRYIDRIKGLFFFRKEFGKNTKELFKNVGYVGVGSGVSILLILILNVLGGRILGPEIYGEFTLVSSIALFLVLPMLVGVDMAVMKYGAEYDRKHKLFTLFSTALLLASLFIVLWSVIFFLVVPFITSFTALSSKIFYFAIGFAATYALYAISSSIFRGMKDWRGLVIIKVFYAITALIAFLVLVYWVKPTSSSLIIPFYIAYGITFLFLIKKIGLSLLNKYDPKIAKQLLLYGFFAMLSGFALAIYGVVDKLILNEYLGLTEVGIFRAYWFFSFNVVISGFGIFNSVFFPMVSGMIQKKAILLKIKRFTPYIFIIGVPGVFVVLLIGLMLFGRAYQFNALWAFLLAIAACMFFLYQVLTWLLISAGIRAMRAGAVLSFIFVLINIFFNMLLIPNFGILGAILANLIFFTVVVAVLFLSIGRYLNE